MDVLSNWESSCAASSVASFWCLPSATPALMLEPESTLMHLNLQRHTNTLTTKVQYWSCHAGTDSRHIQSLTHEDVTTSIQWASNRLFSWNTFWYFTDKRCWFCSCYKNKQISSRWGWFTCQKKLKTHETIAEEAVTTGDVIKNAQDTQELKICVKRCSTQWSRSFRLKLKKMISRVKCSLRIKI